MITCPHCDRANPPENRLCAGCGAALATEIQPSTADVEARVRQLLADGRKIEAVKIYRELTGASLAEAKEAVESLAQSHKSAVVQRNGCLGAFLGMALALGFATVMAARELVD